MGQLTVGSNPTPSAKPSPDVRWTDPPVSGAMRPRNGYARGEVEAVFVGAGFAGLDEALQLIAAAFELGDVVADLGQAP